MKYIYWIAALPILLIKPGFSQDKVHQSLPLQATETIEFTVDEATWMSVDISPDGSTLVFDLLGDLYILPSKGGEASRIIGGISFESQPRYSPDGSTILFLSDRSGVENLWLANKDGSNPRALSKDSTTKTKPQRMASPSWTADGKYVLVSKSRPPEETFAVFMYHKDGGTGIRIGSPPPEKKIAPDGRRIQAPNRLGAAASLDNRFIYYAERQGRFNYNAQFPIWQIIRFDRDTGETATITNAPGSAMRPVISPDGKHLVYGTRFRTETALRVRNLDTGKERWLTHSVTRDDQESQASRDTLPGYVFTPDGNALIVPVHGKLHRIDFETGASTQIPFIARVAAEIGPRIHFNHRVEDGKTVSTRLIRWPRLSPDLKQLVFSAFNHIYIMDLPHGAPRRVTSLDVGEFMPSWSPDGVFIAFATWSTDGGHLYRVRVDGTQPPERLTLNANFYSDPVYTPSGDKLVFVAGTARDQLYSFLSESRAHAPDENRDLWEIRGVPSTGVLDLKYIAADGGPTTFIASTKGGRYPYFTKDPERIFLTTREGLSSIRLDGFNRRIHFKVTGIGPGPNPPVAEEIRLSPDGKQAFVDLQNKHYLVEVPKAGKEIVEIKIGSNDAVVPVTELSGVGGHYLHWSSDGSQVVWSEGKHFYRRTVLPEIAKEMEAVEVNVELPRHKPKGTVVLRGAERIITMLGDEVTNGGDIIITNNRITWIGRKTELPAGTEIIDVSGKTIMPGFVDIHSHMWAPRGVHQMQIWQYLANLAYGVTTTRDPQTSTDDVFAYADLIEAGKILGPRVYATGPGVVAQSGVVDQAAADNLLRRYAEAYNSHTIKQYMVGDRIVRQWVAKACKKHSLTPTTEGGLDLKLDLTQMADGYSGNEHSLPIIPIYEDIAQYVARTETFYTPTILVAYGGPWSENFFFENTDVANDEKLRRFIPFQILDNMIRRRSQWFIEEEYQHKGISEGCMKIIQAGGKCGLGSHGQIQGIGAHWEIWALQSGGLTEHETLRAATLHGAEAIGLAQDLGSLEPGKIADILVLDANPLEDIRNTNSVRYVMKNGELFEATTLDQIWPQRKPLPTQFWWNDQPNMKKDR